MLRFSSSLLLFCLVLVLSLISATCAATVTTSDTSTNDIIAKFKSAREARKAAGTAAQVAVTSTSTSTSTADREAGAVEFETRRAALLAHAAENAPLERDVEWEQQLLEDRRSVHFSRDRSIIDDTQHVQHVGSVAGIRPSEL